MCLSLPPPPKLCSVHPSLQSLAELSTLQGLEDDHTFQKEVSLKTLVYKAYRSEFFCSLNVSAAPSIHKAHEGCNWYNKL